MAHDWLFQIGFGNILIPPGPTLKTEKTKHCLCRYQLHQIVLVDIVHNNFQNLRSNKTTTQINIVHNKSAVSISSTKNTILIKISECKTVVMTRYLGPPPAPDIWSSQPFVHSDIFMSKRFIMQISDVDTDFYIKEKLNKIKQTTLTPTIYRLGCVIKSIQMNNPNNISTRMRHKINPDEQSHTVWYRTGRIWFSYCRQPLILFKLKARILPLPMPRP